ncbi:hypothetical protein [Herbaspirillum sp. NPDC101396]|uniref:hypothetical protein n=1 Tax=Herbaspirillum sp. NPDC101396 TaxID=3364005 RepID=UPI00383B05C5
MNRLADKLPLTAFLPRLSFGSRAVWSTLALSTVAVGVLLRDLLAGHATAIWFGYAADLGLTVYLLCEVHVLARIVKTTVWLTLLLALAALLSWPSGWQVVAQGLDRSTTVAAILAAMGFMVEAARTSPLIRRVGYTVIGQPKSRRYVVLTAGAHLLAIVLNVGAINLLGNMVRRSNTLAAAGGDAQLQAQRLRESSVAIIRGFGTMAMWSPLSIGFAVALASVPALHWQELLPYAMALSLSYLLLGWLLDGVHWKTAAAINTSSPRADWRAVHGFVALILAVIAAALAAAFALHASVSDGVMLVVPPVALLWLVRQYARAGVSSALALTARRMRQRLFQIFPGFRTEICMIASGALLGTLLGHALHLQAIPALLAQAALHPVLLAGLLLPAIIAVAQLGVGAVVGIGIVSAAIPDPALLGLKPVVLAFVFLSSWVLAGGITPYGATIAIMARAADVPGRVVALQWNGRFTLTGYGVSLAWFAALQAWT